MLINIDIKGKGILENKTMKVEGSALTLEGVAGAWYWIKQEGCFRIGDSVYYTGDYDPEKEVACSIIVVEGETLDELPNEISLNDLKFVKYTSADEAVAEEPPAETASAESAAQEPQASEDVLEDSAEASVEEGVKTSEEVAAEEPAETASAVEAASEEPPAETASAGQDDAQEVQADDEASLEKEGKALLELEEKYAALESEKSSLEAEVEKLRGELESKGDEHALLELEGKYSSLEIEKASLEGVVENLRAELDSKGDEQALQGLEEKCSSLETEKSNLESEKSSLVGEVEKLTSDLERVRQKSDKAEKAYQQKIQDTKQKSINFSIEKGELENKIEDLRAEMESSNQSRDRMEEAYKNKLEDLHFKTEESLMEARLTAETYESTLRGRRETFAKVNKWMSKVSGMEERDNPNEKAARIEKLVMERWNLLEDNKKLRGMLKLAEEEREEIKQPSFDRDESDMLELDSGIDDDLENVFTYVVLSIHMSCHGDKNQTLEKIDRILNGFQIIDPADEGLAEKDILLIGDYLQSRSEQHSESSGQDLGFMVNFVKDEIEKILDMPEFSDPSKRVSLRQGLKEAYDRYTPVTTR